ncbi:IclR family transcriptional regulator [Actinomadura rubrisoli]|uniref:IclR family transcriptional regulator n=1 Tax=Actinomadura rubrisoli TaxID=2530368 RepID=UPI001A9FA102|nr:IclR family transcriptional regulator C-terminal domain-containing protein [Actinomadura rubrisoli]
MLEALENLEVAGLSRLAAVSGLPKTTAHRLLEQLIDLGAAERANVRGHYRLGPRLLQLGRAWQPVPGLAAAADGPMRALAAATGATVGVCVLRTGRTLVVAGAVGEVDSLAPLLPGATWPWSTAAGKLLVAAARPGLPLGPMPGGWKQTAASIRSDGLAVDREELVAGVFCVAAPVRARGGAVVAALCVLTGTADRLHRLAQPAVRASRIISGNLGKPHGGSVTSRRGS